MSVERELREWEERLERGEPEAWRGLATTALRLGRRPEILMAPGMVDRLLARLVEDPAPARLLEACLPFHILSAVGGDLDPESGRPVRVRLVPEGGVLLLGADGKTWVGARTLDPEALKEAGCGLREPPNPSRCARSLAWFQAAEYAQQLTDQLRAAGTLAPSWELRLPRFGGRRHRFPQTKRRLELARARRKTPAPPVLEHDCVYTAFCGAGIRRSCRYHPDGVLTHTILTDLARVHEELERAGGTRWQGRWQRDGRGLKAWARGPEGRIEWEGFLGDDRGLYLISTSRITGHQSALLLRKARRPS